MEKQRLDSEAKPTKKCQAGVVLHGIKGRYIHFNADSEIAEEFKEFGTLEELANVYSLIVDGRYDFQEVLEYIKNYG